MTPIEGCEGDIRAIVTHHSSAGNSSFVLSDSTAAGIAPVFRS
jgi:hypothetical protein